VRAGCCGVIQGHHSSVLIVCSIPAQDAVKVGGKTPRNMEVVLFYCIAVNLYGLVQSLLDRDSGCYGAALTLENNSRSQTATNQITTHETTTTS
jgi:hypothetical protein